MISCASQADRARVVVAHGALLNAYRTARAAASALGEPVTLFWSEDSVVVRSVSGTSLLRTSGPKAGGVGMTPTAHQVRFGPNGVPVGPANVTISLTRGSIVRHLVVSRLGRIRVS